VRCGAGPAASGAVRRVSLVAVLLFASCHVSGECGSLLWVRGWGVVVFAGVSQLVAISELALVDGSWELSVERDARTRATGKIVGSVLVARSSAQLLPVLGDSADLGISRRSRTAPHLVSITRLPT